MSKKIPINFHSIVEYLWQQSYAFQVRLKFDLI